MLTLWEVKMADNEEQATWGHVAGFGAGAVAGATIATGLTAVTGGLAAPLAPIIYGACTGAGARLGYDPKGTVLPVMGAIGKLLGGGS
jgi:hypothetical protein